MSIGYDVRVLRRRRFRRGVHRAHRKAGRLPRHGRDVVLVPSRTPLPTKKSGTVMRWG